MNMCVCVCVCVCVYGLESNLPAGEKTWKTPILLQEGAGLFYKVPRTK